MSFKRKGRGNSRNLSSRVRNSVIHWRRKGLSRERPDALPRPNVVSTARTWRVSRRSESKRIFASIKLGRKFGFLWCAPLSGDHIASSCFRRETSPFVFFAHAIRISRSNFLRGRERERERSCSKMETFKIDRGSFEIDGSVRRSIVGTVRCGWVRYRGVEYRCAGKAIESWHFAKIGLGTPWWLTPARHVNMRGASWF